MGEDRDQFANRVPTGRVRRGLLIVAGIGCVGMAYLGVLLPGLPATPWVLLASVCFARSSPRLHRWLLRSPLFGRLLQDWHDHRGIRGPVKALACISVIAACTISVGFAGLPTPARVGIAISGLIGLSVILFVVPTVRDHPSSK